MLIINSLFYKYSECFGRSYNYKLGFILLFNELRPQQGELPKVLSEIHDLL